jgi:2-methylcitrate dehydratase PrpD
VRTVIRPTWTAESEEQRKALAAAVRAAEAARKAEQAAKKAEDAMWAALLRARAAGVPDEPLCRETGASRATLNRKFGTRSGPKGEAPTAG